MSTILSMPKVSLVLHSTFNLLLVRTRVDTEMETVPCGTTNYNYTNVEEIVLKQVSVANCVKDKSLLKVKGTLYGKHAQFLEIRVQPCLDPTTVDNINSTICANMSE